MKGLVLVSTLLTILFEVTYAVNMSSKWTNDPVYIIGFSVLPLEIRKKTFFDHHGHLHVPESSNLLMKLYGKFTVNTTFKFVKNADCTNTAEPEVLLEIMDGSDDTVAKVHVKLPAVYKDKSQSKAYFCLRDGSWPEGKLQGFFISEDGVKDVYPWLTVKLVKPQFPLWFFIITIIVLLSLSSLFSGLNLGLLSLDKTDLKVIINTGTVNERKQASSIVPVRNHGNFLLSCLVFSNVLVNTTLTILMDEIFSGDWETVVVTTFAIVIFGEILPQALCCRHGLAVGAKTIWITKTFMFISFPLAYPVGKLLDKVLGEEVGAVYTRDRLKELVKVTRDQHGLETEEVGIISGALEMRSKMVKEIMTPIEKIFMLSLDAILNFEVLADIEYKGYTRIPIYQNDRSNVVALVNVKHLTLVDPDDKIPVKDIVNQHKIQLFFVFENTRLDYMFKAFKEGSRGHMAFVKGLVLEPSEQAQYDTVGIVTMEDVLEELLQVEIYDENDFGRLNRSRSLLNADGTIGTPPLMPYKY